jgi:hypothetical protein
MDSNFTFVLPMLYLRTLRMCVKFVLILPLAAVVQIFWLPVDQR